MPVEVIVLQYAPAPIAEQSELKLHASPIAFAVVVQSPALQLWLPGHWTQRLPLVPHENWELPGEQKPF